MFVSISGAKRRWVDGRTIRAAGSEQDTGAPAFDDKGVETVAL